MNKYKIRLKMEFEGYVEFEEEAESIEDLTDKYLCTSAYDIPLDLQIQAQSDAECRNPVISLESIVRIKGVA